MTTMEGNAALATRRLDKDALVKELRKQVTALEDDLRTRSDEVEEFATALRAEYDEAREAKRTAATYGAWRDERLTQVAAAWVLGTVFVRFCEDNGLIELPFLAGPGERLADAEERHEAFFRANPQLNDRDWFVEAFNYLAATHPTVAGLFDKRHNPLWEITPSFEAATALIGFWRRRGDDGEIRFDFTDTEWDTRFLGDLYQDLSEHARKTYALLQTPEFVEEFILDLTLEPAVDEFGLAGLRTIDPACGSGHFLLGIFARLLGKWRAAEPGTDDWELIRRSLESVHGCDKNPFAASIARFRLLVAALRAANQPHFSKAAMFPINVAVGDSLLHGRGAPGVQVDLFDPVDTYTYRTEDIDNFGEQCNLLGRSSYHVVVGNPPYITVKDKQENLNYRRGYDACSGTYALSVPFSQCLFKLAIRTHGSDRTAGHVGQITASSFTKNKFGKKLIEEFFPTVHLTHVIDTSGPKIPGHGTPTVILVGRNHLGRIEEPVRTVLGVRGEPTQATDPSQGVVWRAIVDQMGKPGSESEWISVEDRERSRLLTYPWSLSGGGVTAVTDAILASSNPGSPLIEPPVGRAIRAGADEAYIRPVRRSMRTIADKKALRPLIRGESVRDWNAKATSRIWYPYDNSVDDAEFSRELWQWRTLLAARRTFQGDMADAGLSWWKYMQHTASAYKTPLSITYAAQATHNHFALDRGGNIFKQSAPVVKLRNDASEEDHYGILAVLNSSIACFWLRDVSAPKGGSGEGRGVQDEKWEERFVLNGGSLEKFPFPENPPSNLGRKLDSLSQYAASCEPSILIETQIPTRQNLDEARTLHEQTQGQMIALQEELDWQIYGLYDLLSSNEAKQVTAAAMDLNSVPEIKLGERAFEIVLARSMRADEVQTSWFTRHYSNPITEIPKHWPSWYRDIVQARVSCIEKRSDIALIERPEHKRRWANVSWQKREAEALRAWLLNQCENPEVWFALRDGMKQPRTLTVNQLADNFRDNKDVHAVAQLYAADHLGKRDFTLAQVLERAVTEEHVPYLAALRYKDSGIRKRTEWEKVWEMQREEDQSGQRLEIPVPPKYRSTDFVKLSYWSLRDELDVHKERFVSYPEANPDSDPTLLLGWAGWDHKDQAQAIVNIVNDRIEQSGWGRDKITPLLAGLQELMPWVKQWHGEYDNEWGGIPAEEYSAYLTSQRAAHQLTEDDLRKWRPAAPTRGRRATKKG